MNIVILGNGNVATHLSEALLNAGYSVLQLWKRGEKLRDADLYFIAVSDDSIEEVAKLIPKNKFFAHTSGSVSLKNGGVFYPLQTFSKNIEVDWKNIPIFVEADEKKIEEVLLEIAKKISNNVQIADAEKRRQLHLSAVFACNFTNHLWTISEELLNEKNLSFDVLKPLIEQTFRKIENHSPKNVQTGPAVRNDLKILERHRNMLRNAVIPAKAGIPLNKGNGGQQGDSRLRGNDTTAEIYDTLTKSIQNTHGSH